MADGKPGIGLLDRPRSRKRRRGPEQGGEPTASTRLVIEELGLEPARRRSIGAAFRLSRLGLQRPTSERSPGWAEGVRAEPPMRSRRRSRARRRGPSRHPPPTPMTGTTSCRVVLGEAWPLGLLDRADHRAVRSGELAGADVRTASRRVAAAAAGVAGRPSSTAHSGSAHAVHRRVEEGGELAAVAGGEPAVVGAGVRSAHPDRLLPESLAS